MDNLKHIIEPLTDQELKYLQSYIRKRNSFKGQIIYSSSDDNKYIYCLIRGNIKIGLNQNEPNEIITMILGWQSFFGLKNLSELQQTEEFAEAITACEYYEIDVAAIKHVGKKNPNFTYLLVQQLLAGQRWFELRLQMVHYNLSIKDRVLALFRLLAKYQGQLIGTDTKVSLPMTQAQLAEFAMTTRQSFNQAMRDLEVEGRIYYTREYVLLRETV